MKKLLVVILLAALMLTVCACASDGVYETDGLRLTVDWDQCQIGDGQYVYNYNREKTGGVEKIVITYPNGAQYCVNGMDGVVLFIRVYQPGDISEYVSPETLYAAIYDQRPIFQGFNGYFILALLLGVADVLIGVIFVVFPEKTYTTLSSWFSRNVTPTDRAISWTAVRGITIIVAGLLLIVTVLVCAFS